MAFGVLGAIAIAPPVIAYPRETATSSMPTRADRALLYETLTAPPVDAARSRPIRSTRSSLNPNLRDRMPRIDLDIITFETGSWEVTPQEAAKLAAIAQAIRRAIEQNPNEVYLIEGHTDAVGDEVDNLSLSDRRAEAVRDRAHRAVRRFRRKT